MPTKTDAPNGSQWIGVMTLIVCALYFIFLFPSHENIVYNRDDGSIYMTLALNIAEQGKYSTELPQAVAAAGDDYSRHATWPPLFPAYLAAMISSFGLNWYAIKVALALLGVLTIAIYWRILSATLIGRIAVLMLAVNPAFFVFSHHAMPEAALMLLISSTLLLLSRTQSTMHAALAGISAGAAFLTKGYGITLIPAGVLFLWAFAEGSRRHRFRFVAAFLIPSAIAVIGWWLYTSNFISAGNIDEFTARYGNAPHLMQLLQNFIDHPMDELRQFYWYESRYPLLLLTPFLLFRDVAENALFAIISLLIGALAIYGAFLAISKEKSALAIWMLAHIAFLTIFGGHSFRYWLPLTPAIAYTAFLGIHEVLSRLALDHASKVVMGGFLALSIGGLGYHLAVPERLRFHDAYVQQFREMGLWIKSNTAENSILVVSGGVGDALIFSERIAYPLADIAKALAHARSEPGSTANVYLACPTDAAGDLAWGKIGACEDVAQARGLLLSSAWESPMQQLFILE
jgi:4-amino-4-deoxy-L-arabinose transferase-like glycosyltransferase